MARSAPSTTRSSLVEDIGYLASRVMRALGDESVEPQARAIAQYMLLCKDMSRDECASLFDKPGAGRLIDKLLDCESEFMGPTPRAVGIDAVVFTTAHKMQQSLDVKQFQVRTNSFACVGRVTPNIKNNILFSDKTFIWIRFHCAALTEEECLRPVDIFESRTFKTLDDVEKYFKTHSGGVHEFSVDSGGGETVSARPRASNGAGAKSGKHEVIITNKATVFKVCENVYEIYVVKTSAQSNGLKLDYLLHRYGESSDYSMIFCSELKHFQYSPLLFVSNYLKFTYCYSLNRDIFDPRRYDEIKATVLYLSQCSLFMATGNLTNMPRDTHGPLIAYTGERPKIMLSKFKSVDATRTAVYNNEGTRAMQTMNKSSDLGARSNYVEVVSKIDLDPSVLDRIA